FHVLDGLVEQLADQKPADRVQGGLLAVEVEIALTSRSQLHQPFFVGQLQYDLFQFIPVTHLCSAPPQKLPSVATPQAHGIQPDNLRQNRPYRNLCYPARPISTGHPRTNTPRNRR